MGALIHVTACSCVVRRLDCIHSAAASIGVPAHTHNCKTIGKSVTVPPANDLRSSPLRSRPSGLALQKSCSRSIHMLVCVLASQGVRRCQ